VGRTLVANRWLAGSACGKRRIVRPLNAIVRQHKEMTWQVWTDAQFEEMSWHDNHVHALRIVEAGEGAGDLILDIDHIVEWIKGVPGFQFRIVPAKLTFHDVMFPRIALDYAAGTSAFAPFMIHGIERREEQRAHYLAILWKIAISCPVGEISFEARGFTQEAMSAPILSSGQCLSSEERTRAA
jgi:hypothetical protein